MKRVFVIAMILCLLSPVSVRAELELELDPVEQDLLMERRPIAGEQGVEPVEKKKNWLYLLLGVGVLGAAAGGGGGGGDGSSTDGSMSISW